MHVPGMHVCVCNINTTLTENVRPFSGQYEDQAVLTFTPSVVRDSTQELGS